MEHTPASVETRSAHRIRAHYEIERELSDRLRAAPADERPALYPELYDTLFRRVPDHPQLTAPSNEGARERDVAAQLSFLRHFLRPGRTFLEIGAGDCALSRAVASKAGDVYVLDVSEAILSHAGDSDELRVVLSDGISIDVAPETIDLAYSNQVMEHLHPDDAAAQLTNVHRALASGGRYVCVTPNRLNGPHDVSKYFDRVATGFHLREYTVTELARIMESAGFTRVWAYAHVRGKTMRLPMLGVGLVEAAIERLPQRARKRVASGRPWRWALGICIVAEKD